MPLNLKDLGIHLAPEGRKNIPDPTVLYDLIIIGGGPAGMTAAVYASRKRFRALLIAKDLGGQVLWTSDIENYMGYQYITGQELSKKFGEQMEANPIDMQMPDEVEMLKVEPGQIFRVKTKNKKEFTAKSVVIASGKRYRSLGVPGEREFLGKGVAYCATCDAPLFAGKDVAVIGGGNSALTAVNDLLKVANQVKLVNIMPNLQGDAVLVEKARDPRVELFLGWETVAIKGLDKVEAIQIINRKNKESRELKVQGVFIEIGLEPNSEFAKGVLLLNEHYEIIVDCSCRTSVIGIFAAGDVTNVQEKQIIVAAGDGAKASLAAYSYILNRGA